MVTSCVVLGRIKQLTMVLRLRSSVFMNPSILTVLHSAENVLINADQPAVLTGLIRTFQQQLQEDL